ncbi:hypothetical protein DM01DRAFT_310372 [Hesseltinella vesiculosa]|uniref:Uncharacterized protein n=1 Tax=Hesseltinella vesiculosa TaxID=101127 RepID=A0A1X2GR39_9FUNG|nr:hypothetical protein DM01DRAFT_310372 [Hesseltinella vesiculosa]
MNRNDAALQAVLVPWLLTGSRQGEMVTCLVDLLTAIGQACKPWEVEAWVIQELGDLADWPQHLATMDRWVMLVLVTLQVFGRTVLEPLAERGDRALEMLGAWLPNVCKTALSMVAWLMDESRYVEAQAITNGVLDVICFYGSEQALEKTDTAIDLYLELFEKYGLTAMDLCKPYFEQFHPQHSVRQSALTTSNGKVTHHQQDHCECITRCLV